MSEILFFIFVIIALVFLYGIVRGICKRIFLIMKLRELKKETGALIKYHTLPFLSLIRFSSKPEITVELGDNVYLVRLINSKSKLRRFHFASPEFTVTTKGRRFQGGVRIVDAGRALLRRRGAVHVRTDYFSRKIGKVRLLPKLVIPDESLYRGKKLISVLIFNPAPHDVTYVTPEKNRIIAAFTGDDVYGQLIFTASSFVTYVDRVERQEKEKRSGASSYWDEYFS